MQKPALTIAYRVIVPSLWLAVVVWTFMQWHRGDTTFEQFLTTAGTIAMLWFFYAAVPLIKARLARRTRTPPEYRPTNLGG